MVYMVYMCDNHVYGVNVLVFDVGWMGGPEAFCFCFLGSDKEKFICKILLTALF